MAAEKGEKTQAALSLGLIYLHGNDRDIDNEKAKYWLTIAAENGEPRATYWLGVMHQYGFGYPKDINRARECYQKALNAGVKESQEKLDELK
ncbi:hypothetical protein NB640_00875 [Oxalobacter vibrioformis]|uniref:Sel1 repeat family protein n=1 Tax=Oxalobacter vibrioformis TaxID=933080 RepID=A0A9E9LZ64_9BURK|nr:hypothetical protein [Oxalobacter vibrioformis]WAW10252.1 hypothetical protein NB640_00875 [Oxalobacter vibrioformis]